MNKTNGRGVDLVLNSLAEDKLQASVRCLSNLGRFLEIGRVDIAKNSLLGELIMYNKLFFSIAYTRSYIFILRME